MNEHQSIKYKEFEITPHSDGFQFSPETMIRIASFIVSKDKIISAFAFSDGGISLRMAHLEIKDEDLLAGAETIIKKCIDVGTIEHLEEYTFEYHPSEYIPVKDPKWWIKSLKEIYNYK